jgi:hypothetical protein
LSPPRGSVCFVLFPLFVPGASQRKTIPGGLLLMLRTGERNNSIRVSEGTCWIWSHHVAKWSDHAKICAEEHHRAIFSFVASLLESRLSKVVTLHARLHVALSLSRPFAMHTSCQIGTAFKCTFSSQLVTVIVELQCLHNRLLRPVWMAMLHNATACRHSIVVTRQESYYFWTSMGRLCCS